MSAIAGRSGGALVLSAGGPLGAAWQIGLLAGLAGAGADLSSLDQIIGTSAGAIVGCQLAVGSTMEQMMDGQVARARYLRDNPQHAGPATARAVTFLDELAAVGSAQICAGALDAEAVISEHGFAPPPPQQRPGAPGRTLRFQRGSDRLPPEPP